MILKKPVERQSKQAGATKKLSKLEVWEQGLKKDLPSELLYKRLQEPQNTQPSTLRLQNRLAVISSRPFQTTLQKYCSLRQIKRSDDLTKIEWKNLDALVIEARVYRVESPWRRLVLNIGGEGAFLHALLSTAKAHGVPAVLWITEEADSIDLFRHLFDKVDLVLLPPGAEETGENFLQLPPPVDVKTYNPLTNSQLKKRGRDPLFPIVLDGCHELGMTMSPEDAAQAFAPIFEYNWWMTDSSYTIRNNNHKIHPLMRRRFIGSLPEDRMVELLKNASVYFLPKDITDRRRRHAQKRMLEAAATKTCVVSDTATADFPFVATVPEFREMAEYIQWAMNDQVGAAAVRQQAWRFAVGECSYFEVLGTILSRLGVETLSNRPLKPHVNVVMPTIRPDLIPFTLEACAAQTHENISLTIIANGVPVPKDIEAMVEAYPGATIASIPNDKSIGYCMNYGIDLVEADFWAKIDDDDIYGANFLHDLILQEKYVDFDITGKAAMFTFFEEQNKVHIRRINEQDVPARFLGGGTLLVKQGTNYFPEDIRGYADTMFLMQAEDKGARVIAGDPFNFVQVRRADPTSHTWTAGSHTLNLNGPQRDGLNLTSVLV